MVVTVGVIVHQKDVLGHFDLPMPPGLQSKVGRVVGQRFAHQPRARNRAVRAWARLSPRRSRILSIVSMKESSLSAKPRSWMRSFHLTTRSFASALLPTRS